MAPGDNELDRAVNDLHSHVSAWWPQEHFLPHAPIVDLTPGQVAILRRQEGSLLATATGLDSASLQRPGTASVDATLFVGNHPDSTAGSCQ